MSGLREQAPASGTGAPAARHTLVAREVAVEVEDGVLLRPTSLEVVTGTMTALIGPSGSGKTTLLRALAGVTAPTEGEVTLDGEPVSSKLLDVGYLPVGDTVHDELTLREALDYAAALRLKRDVPREEVAARIDAVLSELRLDDRADVRIGTLSTGERKRAACALELIGQPAMLLLDEPGTGLDPALERRLMQIMRRVADQGRGVVVVTHATSSLELCDTVAVMGAGGRLAFVGSYPAMLEHFGVRHPDAIFDALGDVELAGEEEPEVPRAVVRPVKRPPTIVTAPFGHQVAVLASRSAKVLGRDTRTLTLLLVQAPVIGLLVGLVLPTRVLTEETALASFYGVLLAFLLLTGSTWLGVVTTCRAVVRERALMEREAVAGVRLDAYLTSKVLVLFALNVVQVVLLAVVVWVLQPLNAGGGAYLSLFALCVGAAWASAAMGLALSAWVRTPEQASSAVPLLLIPQLLLAGAIIPTGVMPPPMQALSALTFDRWALAGGGNALGLDTKLSDDVSAVAGYDRGFFDLSPAFGVAVLLVFCVLTLGVASGGLNRRVAS